MDLQPIQETVTYLFLQYAHMASGHVISFSPSLKSLLVSLFVQFFLCSPQSDFWHWDEQYFCLRHLWQNFSLQEIPQTGQVSKRIGLNSSPSESTTSCKTWSGRISLLFKSSAWLIPLHSRLCLCVQSLVWQSLEQYETFSQPVHFFKWFDSKLQ